MVYPVYATIHEQLLDAVKADKIDGVERLLKVGANPKMSDQC